MTDLYNNTPSNAIVNAVSDITYQAGNTVVKELRSKMLGQHPGYFKAVFLKKTQIIIVNIYKYTVYIMF